MKKSMTFASDFDGLDLELKIIAPDENPVGIIQIAHGMSEHKERYADFMEFLANAGFVTVIHDHRGHGASVKSLDDLGFFYTENMDAIVDDLHQVTCFIKETYPGLPVFLFGFSMGTLVSRCYMKKYDNEVDKVVLCGSPTKKIGVSGGILLAKFIGAVKGEKYRSPLIEKIVLGTYRTKYRKKKHEWISSDSHVVDEYNDDILSGYNFTANGYLNLFNLQKNAYDNGNWNVKNPELPIFIISGANDPVMQSSALLKDMKVFLEKTGYKNIMMKIYQEKRHELINEIGHEAVYQDVLAFSKGEAVSDLEK